MQLSCKGMARLMRQLGSEGVSQARQAATHNEALCASSRGRRSGPPARPSLRAESVLGREHYVRADLGGFLFLASLLDAWSRRCIGWSMRNDLNGELVIDAPGMAVTRWRPRPSVIHHLDRGSQYTTLALPRPSPRAESCRAWAAGAAFDNPLAESFFATLETALMDRRTR